MFNKKVFWIILFIIPLFLCMSPANTGHASDSGEFLGKVVNFAVLLGGLFVLLRKPIKNYFNERSKKADLSIKEAVEDRTGSEKKLKEALGRLGEISEEVKKIKEDAESEGKKQKESIIKDTRQEAQRLKELTKQEIDSLYASGIKELRVFAAETATKAAADRVKRRMTPELQSAIIDKSIERLDDLYESTDNR